MGSTHPSEAPLYRSIPKALTATAAVAALAFLGAAPANASGATGRWRNCTAYNHVYPHGVGRTHAHDHTSATPVTNFRHSTRLYRIAMNHNKGLDRDKDGIACEQA